MTIRACIRQMSRAIAFALVLSLVVAAPVFAEPSTSADPTASAPAVTAPPAAPATTRRAPADTSSAIGVTPDRDTRKFRDELAERQQRLDEFMAQLDALDRELEVASEQYNAAVERLAEMKQLVQTAKGDLDNAQHAYDVQTDILEERAESLYKEGSFGAVEVLLDAKSVADLVARIKFLNTIGIRDADIAASLKGQRQLLEDQLEKLRQSEDAALALEFELKARQIEIMLRIQEREQMLAEAQTDLLELLDSEAARRSAEEAALLAEVLSGANAKGIQVAAGTPVETAFAYHGIPYLWGGKTPRGFDCSGLVFYVFQQHGVTLPHYSGAQFQRGEKIPPAALQPADAVFFGSPIHHVGIYIGGGYYIHAPRTGDFVKISKLADRRDYAGARRYPWVPRVGAPTGARSSTASALGDLSR